MNFSFQQGLNICTGITKECFEWCKNQHFVNDYQNIHLLIAGLIVFIIYLGTTLLPEETKKLKGFPDSRIFIYIMAFYLTSFLILWYFNYQ